MAGAAIQGLFFKPLVPDSNPNFSDRLNGDNFLSVFSKRSWRQCCSRRKILNNRRTTFLFFGLVALLAVALGGLTFANYRFAQENPGGNDFLARWTGAHYWLVEGVSPYDARVSLAAQEMIYGRPARPQAGEDVAHFVYPLPSMLFFGLFGLIDFLPARALWMTVLEICLVALALVSLRLVEWRLSPIGTALIVLFAIVWYHGARTILVGQFAAINALLIASALLLIRRNQDTGAGLLLALTIAKPQMSFLIIPLVLIWGISTGRRELLGGFFGGFIGLLMVSLFLIPDWPLQMLWQIQDYPNYTDIGSPLSIIAGAAPGIRGPLTIALNGVLLIYLLWIWIAVWGKDYRFFLWTAMVTLVITNLVAFRTATTNYVMLFPVLLSIFQVWDDRWDGVGSGLVWLTSALLGIGLWILFLFTVDGNVESAVMYLPLPFLCLLGLWWTRWWVIRPPRLELDELAARLNQ
jgi:hypothetical protein